MEVRKNTAGKTTMDPTTDHHHHHDAAFWLPTHFLSDDDLLYAAADHPKTFDPFDSPVSSCQTDNDVDHELLARSSVHHHISNPEKPWMFSTSPQSTLTGFGPWSNRSGFTSPNGPSRIPSPPLTPPGAKSDAAWELLYEAAGQIARLKMNAMAAQLKLHNHHHQQQNRGGLYGSSNISLSSKSHSLYDIPNTNQYEQLKRQGREEWYCQHHEQSRSSGGHIQPVSGALGVPESAWPPVRAVAHNHRQLSGGPGGPDMRAVFLGGRGSGSGHAASPAVKRQSTGTGVFIPVSQRVEIQQAGPRKRPSDVLIARRNALLSQQRRTNMKVEGGGATMVGGHDICLPTDWTY